MKLDSYLTPYLNFNLKWIRDLVRARTIKLSTEMGINLSDHAFLDITSKAQATKEKLN